MSIHFLKVNFIGGIDVSFPPSLYVVLVGKKKTFQRAHTISWDIPKELLATNIISEAMLEKTPPVKNTVGVVEVMLLKE